MFLSAYLYEFNFSDDTCRSVKVIERSLNKQQWTRFSRSIYHADFWGMKPNKEVLGRDGSSLIVRGYEGARNSYPGNRHVVYRWAAEETALGETFHQALGLAGIPNGCFHFDK